MVAVAKRREVDPEFGRHLRLLRQRASLTLEAFAERVGVAWTSIARIERGESEPTWGTAKRFADALGVKLDDFRDHDADAEPAAAPDDDLPDPSPSDRPLGKRK